MYPIELEIKNITDTDRSASYLDIHLEIDRGGRLITKLIFLEKPLYEICLKRIKEQVSEKMSTACAHRYADYLL
jgi:hypothetical protein